MKTCPPECNAACCRRWWITLLPQELERAAGHASIPRKEFIEGKCVLYAELYPLEEKKQGIVVFNELLPKGIAEKVREGFGSLPDFFLALPFMAFKRMDEKCVFLSGENLCSIYGARPRQCELFPQISLEKGKKLNELYDFCSLAAEKDSKGLDQEHLDRLRDYFSEVEGLGFARVWHSLPETGFVKIGSSVFGVPRRDFLELLGPYS